MTTVRKTSYFNRPDTMLGVCQAIGEDMGINPNWIRVAFAIGFFFYPWQAALAYLGLGALGALLRRVWPDELTSTEAEAAAVRAADNNDTEMKIAA